MRDPKRAIVSTFRKVSTETDQAQQWAGGHWVAASALAYPETLEFVLSHKSNNERRVTLAASLIRYFEQGAPLPNLSAELDNRNT